MKIRISVIIMAIVILLSISFSFAQATVDGKNEPTAKFSDISKHWSKDVVQKLLKKNVIPFNGDKFLPEKAVKRSEFAVILHKALGIKIAYFKAPDIKDYFNDIKQNAPYASAVIDLVTANIFEGKGSFKPEATLSREEMIHYIMQAYKYKMGDKYAMIKIGPASFKDADKIAPQYSGEVARAQYYQLIVGNGNNMFQPKKAATRAEAVAVINRLAELLDGQNQQITVKPEAVVKEDSIEMKITIKNNSKNDIYMETSSGQKFDFELLDADKKVVYRWSDGKMFTMALVTVKIEAGKTLEYSDTSSGDDYKAIKDKIVYMKGYITGKASFISAEGYEIRLK